MRAVGRDEIVLVRHAPAAHGGRLCGRTDVHAILPETPTLAALSQALSPCTPLVSPALRCRQTAGALFPGRDLPTDACLWEQDFGALDGAPFADLPDLGALDLPALAAHRNAGGESFLDVAARLRPLLEDCADRVRAGGGPVALVAHAGIVRAALGQALGAAHLGLSFEVAPLSVTRLRSWSGGLSIIAVNGTGA